MSDQICYENCNITTEVTDLIAKAKKLKDSGENYQEHGDINGAIYSYSNCSSILYTIKTLFENMCDDKDEMNKYLFFEQDIFLAKLENNYQDILNRVDQLQSMLKKNLKKKDEDEISCAEISNVSLSGSDCIFFDDVIGLETQKMEIEETFIKPIIYPSLYGQLSKGILLYGPPGTGKTLLVKSAVNTLATAYKQNNISVIFFSPTAADLKGKYVGESEKKIKELFVCAHRKACECQANDTSNRIFLSVIFIDEIDNVGASRTNDTTGMMKQTVNALLQAMDGVESSKNVIVMGATNNPWELDSALLRRFTNHILVDLPKNNDIKKLIQKEIVEYLNRPDVDITKCLDKKDNSINDNKCDSTCEEKSIDKDYWTNELSNYNRQYNVLISNNDNFLNKIAQSLEKKMNSNSDINQIMNESFSQMADNILHSQTFVDSRNRSIDNKPIYISGISNKNTMSYNLLDTDDQFNSTNYCNLLFNNNNYYLSLFGIDKYKTLLEKPYITIGNDTYINIFFCPDRHPILYNTYKDVNSVYLETECYKSMIKLKQNNYNISDEIIRSNNKSQLSDDEKKKKLIDDDKKNLEKCRILIDKEINIVAVPTDMSFNVIVKDFHAEFILLHMLGEEHIRSDTIIEISFNRLRLYENEVQLYQEIFIDNIDDYFNTTDYEQEEIFRTVNTNISNVKEIRYQYYDIIEKKQIIDKFERLINIRNYQDANVLITVNFIKKNTGSIWIQLIHNVLNAYNNPNTPNESYRHFDTLLRLHKDFADDVDYIDVYNLIRELYVIQKVKIESMSSDKMKESIIIGILKILLDKYKTEKSDLDKLKTEHDNSTSLLDIFKIDDNIKLKNIIELGKNTENIKQYIEFIKSKKIKNNITKKTNIYIECEIDLYNTEFNKVTNDYNTEIIQIAGKTITKTFEFLKQCIVFTINLLKSIFLTMPDLPSENDDNYLDLLSESFYDTYSSIFQNDLVYLLLSNSKKYFYKNNEGGITEVSISTEQNILGGDGKISGVLSVLFSFIISAEMTGDFAGLGSKISEYFQNSILYSWAEKVYGWSKNGLIILQTITEKILETVNKTVGQGLFPFITGMIKTLLESIKGLFAVFSGALSINYLVISTITALFGSWWISDKLKLPNMSTIYFANRLKDKNIYISDTTYKKVFGEDDIQNNFDKLFYDEIHPGFVQQDKVIISKIFNFINHPIQNIHYFINHIRFAFTNNTKLLEKDLYYITNTTNLPIHTPKFILREKNKIIWDGKEIYTHNTNVILKNYNINLNIVKINAQNKISIVNKKDYDNLIKYKEKPQDVIKIYNEK
jgi:SpoVK/Ycf46/Vps4 family AAA+-type ATPase